MTLTLGQVKVKFLENSVKSQTTGHISDATSPTDFILGTKVYPNKANSMTQMPIGQGQISPKLVKNLRTDHILEAISPTDFIFGTKVQPNKAHSSDDLDWMSRSSFQKKKKRKKKGIKN